MLKIGWLQDQVDSLIASLCAKKLNVWYQSSELLHKILHIEIFGAVENNIDEWSFFNYFPHILEETQ